MDQSRRSHTPATGLAGGISTVLQTPWLWVTISIAAISNVTLHGPLHVALPFLIGDTMGQGIGSLGFIYSMLALGSIVSTVWFAQSSHAHPRGPIAYVAWATSGLLVAGFALPLPVLILGLLAAAIGALLSFFGLIWINTIQELVPNEFLGRVSSIDSFGSFVLLPIGYLAVGSLTDSFGSRAVFLASGLLSVLFVLMGLAHPKIRSLH